MNFLLGQSQYILKPSLRNGYHTVTLYRNGSPPHQVLVHRLVLSCHKGSEPARLHVNHIDGNKTNNHLDNLEWCTPKENNHHSRTVLGNDCKGEKHGRAKFTNKHAEKIRQDSRSCKELAEIHGVHPATIRRIKSGSHWQNLKVEPNYQPRQFTDDQIRAIRVDEREPLRLIAQDYDTSVATISRVKNRLVYSDVS